MENKYTIEKLAGYEYITEEKHPNTWAYIKEVGSEVQEQYVPNADFELFKKELTDEGYDKYFLNVFDGLPTDSRIIATPIIKIIKLYDKGKDDRQRGW